ncbi:MAG: hypothetical protein A2Y58_04010 [Chloroflexi bacterium RBG_13_51_52]|nr:MAG: hypothetical protein A2Y58_04010 [Chloroflexi bacterium RBG_13_51_52]
MDPVDILKVIGTAVLPISELRGAIPLAIGTYQFSWYYAYLFGVIGNLLPVPFILLLFNTVIPQLSRIGFLDRIMKWYFAWTKSRSKLIERYGWLGLMIFVAIPLPVTGAWTGSILAALLGLKFRYAFPAIAVGVLLAGVIVTCATALGWAVAGVFTA